MILLCSVLFTTRGAQNLCSKRFNSSSSSAFFFLPTFAITYSLNYGKLKLNRRRRLIQSQWSVERVSLSRWPSSNGIIALPVPQSLQNANGFCSITQDDAMGYYGLKSLHKYFSSTTKWHQWDLERKQAACSTGIGRIKDLIAYQCRICFKSHFYKKRIQLNNK